MNAYDPVLLEMLENPLWTLSEHGRRSGPATEAGPEPRGSQTQAGLPPPEPTVKAHHRDW